MKYILLSLLLSLSTTSLVLAEENSEAGVIKNNIIAMWAAVEKGDVDEYLKYIHNEYTVFGESDTYLQSGKDKERASYSNYLKRAKKIRTFMHHPEITVRGDTAWITYYWTDSSYVGEERFTSQGKSTRIFVKEDGEWLCIHGHFTAVE